VSRRSIILTISCALLALVSLLWLMRDSSVPQTPAEADASSESVTLHPPQPTPEVAKADDDASRESIGTSTNAILPSASPADADKTATLIVHVVAKETGKPLDAVSVTLWPEKPTRRITHGVNRSSGTLYEGLRPGDDGTVEFTSVPTGEALRVHVGSISRAAGSAQKELDPFMPDERREVRIELVTQNDLTFFGRVLARADQKPIARARVLTEHDTGFSQHEPDGHVMPNDPERAAMRETLTDSDGYFELSVAIWNGPHARIEADGYGLAIVIPIHGHETHETASVIALDRVATLRAHILDAGGAALSGQHLLLSTPAYSFNTIHGEASVGWVFIDLPDERWAADSKADGMCVLENVAPGVPLNLVVMNGGKIVYRWPDPLVLYAGETRDLELRLGAGCTLRGRAIDAEDKPAASVEIWLQRNSFAGYFLPQVENKDVARSTTDSDGRFEFKDVAAGTWWVGPRAYYGVDEAHAAMSIAPLAMQVDVGSAPSQDIVLHLHRGIYIRGQVLDPSGARVTSGWVRGGLNSDSMAVTADITSAGEFSLGPLGPGPCALQASGQLPFAASDVVKAEAGARDVILRLRPGATLRGRFVDARTGAATTGEIMLTPEVSRPGTFGSGLSTNTREDGSFEIKELEPGRYGIVGIGTGGRFGVLTGVDSTPAGQTATEIVVPLSSGATLRMKYDGAKKRIRVSITTHGLLVSWGEEILPTKTIEKHVPPGALLLKVIGDDDAELRSMAVDVAAGEVKDIVIHDDK
jgi:hypothetical protein